MRKTLLFAAATMLAVTSANTQQTVKIGLIMAYSGQFADTATQMDNAIKQQKINGKAQNVEVDKIENVKDPAKKQRRDARDSDPLARSEWRPYCGHEVSRS